MPQSICFQFSIGNDTYMQYGCVVMNPDQGEWQKYVQISLQQYYIENKLLKNDEYVDIILYDANILVYDYKVEPYSSSNDRFDYNLYIDTLGDIFTYNGCTRPLYPKNKDISL